MILNLTQVISGKLNKVPFSHRFVPKIEEKANFGILAVNEFDVEGQVTNDGNEIVIDYTLKGVIVYECSRCLDEISKVCEKTIHKIVTRKLPEDSEEDNWYLIEDYLLDLEDIVTYEVLIDLSDQIICSNECKGLCQNCGINLNNETCSCSDEKIDPRLEILKNFFTQK
jgi:uncharacterized protein